jgi:hypothetical protein
MAEFRWYCAPVDSVDAIEEQWLEFVVWKLITVRPAVSL